EVGAEYFGAVEAAREARDDVARDDFSSGGAAIAGFHDVRRQRLELDDIAAPGFCRDIDQSLRHHSTSSVQAASVTTTSTLVCQNEPSDKYAMATTFWLSARRMRVDTCARPLAGLR